MAAPGVTELLKEAIQEMEENFRVKSEDLQKDLTMAYANSRSVGWLKKASAFLHSDGKGGSITKAAVKMAVRSIFR